MRHSHTPAHSHTHTHTLAHTHAYGLSEMDDKTRTSELVREGERTKKITCKQRNMFFFKPRRNKCLFKIVREQKGKNVKCAELEGDFGVVITSL